MGVTEAIVGGLISGAGTLIGSSMTNDANEQIASSNNATAIELANTAHQREVADLRAAGLNPILSATGGKGAAVPSLTSPTLVNSLGDAMSAGISNYSALQTSRQTEALIDKTRTEAKLNDALVLKAAADTSTAMATARNLDAITSAKRFSPMLSSVLGSDWAASAHSTVSPGLDFITDKVKDIVRNVNVNSGRKAAVPPPSPSQIRESWKNHHWETRSDGSEHFVPN